MEGAIFRDRSCGGGVQNGICTARGNKSIVDSLCIREG